jgi:type I restriction enzyme R subunit
LWPCTSTKLSGVTAVQTLSRLNRMARQDTTFVLDFVNDPEVIRESFDPYFKEKLSAVSDRTLCTTSKTS